ncbi:MAG TPA: class E sortase [Mycobacteriales bacterium]|nr:class E sortase [Mycobacteriales bacterium]HWC34212.1 class E sortase [Mycobacteriales bacterium]
MTVTETASDQAVPGTPEDHAAAAASAPASVSSERRRSKVPLSPRTRYTSVVLAALAGLAAWLLLFVFVFSALIEHHNQSVAYSRLREKLALGTVAPFGHDATTGRILKLHDGEPFGLISAPSIGMHRVVFVEGTTSADLQSGPGHLPGTVLPGEAGVSTLLGRSTAYGAPFRKITSLHPGDAVNVTTGQGTYQFTVVDVRGPGQPIPGTLATATSRLTLLTAQRGGWGELWAPTHAVYVDATLTGGKASAIAPGTAPTAADAPMQGDSAGLVPLVLWLQGLVLVAVASAVLGRRWGTKQTWLVGVTLGVAMLWGASGALLQLLPNLF